MTAEPATIGAASIPLADPAERWRPRPVQRLGLWRAGAVPLKAYALLAEAEPPIAEHLVLDAQALVEGSAAMVEAPLSLGRGFVILHRGEEAVWLLLHWWMSGGILAELLWSRPLDGRAGFAPAERPLMACIWELALIDHERRAWVRTAMGPDADRDAYLDDVFRPDFC